MNASDLSKAQELIKKRRESRVSRTDRLSNPVVRADYVELTGRLVLSPRSTADNVKKSSGKAPSRPSKSPQARLRPSPRTPSLSRAKSISTLSQVSRPKRPQTANLATRSSEIGATRHQKLFQQTRKRPQSAASTLIRARTTYREPCIEEPMSSSGNQDEIASPADEFLLWCTSMVENNQTEASIQQVFTDRSVSAKVSFVYAIPEHCFDPELSYNPYRIRIVPQDQVFKPIQGALSRRDVWCDFYTLSPAGVTYHSFQDGSRTFESTRSWVREKEIFTKMKKMRIFSWFPLWKIAKGWINVHRRHRMRRNVKKLEQLIYFSAPNFVNVIAETRQKTLGIEDFCLFSIDTARAQTMSEFKEIQLKTLVNIQSKLSFLINTIKNQLVEASEKTLRQAESTQDDKRRLFTGLTPSSKIDPLDQLLVQALRDSGPDGVSGEHLLNNASWGKPQLKAAELEIEAEQMIEANVTVKWTNAAVKRIVCVRVQKYIRLVDLMIIDALHVMMINNLMKLFQTLQHGVGSNQSMMLDKDAFMESFRAVDSQGTGMLDRAGIKHLLRRVYHGKVSREELDTLVTKFLAVFDSDGDGDVSEGEFSQGLDRILAGGKLQQFDPHTASIYQSSQCQTTQIFVPIPLFVMNLFLNQQGLTYSPDLTDLRTTIQDTIQSFTNVFESVERLLNYNDITPYLVFTSNVNSSLVSEGKSGEWISIYEILKDRANLDPKFTQFKANVLRITDESIEGCVAYASCYEELFQTHLRNINRDFEALQQDYYAEMVSVEDLDEEIQLHQSEVDQIHDLIESEDIQLVRVTTSQLKAKLVVSPLKCLTELAKMLPQLVFEKCQDLLTYINGSSQLLFTRINSLDDFVDYLNHLKRIHQELPSKQAVLNLIQRHVEIIEKAAFTTPDRVQRTYELCFPEMKGLVQAVDECLVNRDRDIKKKRVPLDREMAQLNADVLSLTQASTDLTLYDAGTDPSQAVVYLNQLEERSTVIKSMQRRLVAIQTLFNTSSNEVPVPVVLFENADTATVDVDTKLELWTCLESVATQFKDWRRLSLLKIDRNDVASCLSQVSRVLLNAENAIPDVQKPQELLQQHQKLLTALVPLLTDFQNPDLEKRHWQKIEHKLETKLSMETESGTVVIHGNIHLNQFLSFNVLSKARAIQIVAEEATMEATMVRSLREIVQVWDSYSLPLGRRKDRDQREVTCLGDISDAMVILDETEVMVSSLSNCSHIDHLITKWKGNLSLMRHTLDHLVLCQQYCDQMEAFLSPDFLRMFPDQGKNFVKLDKSWRTLMKDAETCVSLMNFCLAPGLEDQLMGYMSTYDTFYKALEGYLQVKRQIFPRFYDVPDFELAQLLSQCREPRNIEKFIRYCFENVSRIEFGPDVKNCDILAVYSRDLPLSERLELGRNLKARGYAEQWLSAVEKRISERLQKLSRNAHNLAHRSPVWSDQAWLDQHPTQALILAHGTFLSCNLDRNTIQLHVKTLIHRMIKTQCSTRHRIIYSAFLLQAQQYTTCMDSMMEGNCILMEWRDTSSGSHLMVKFNDFQLPYGFIYRSTTSRLVILPQTQKYLFMIFTALRNGQICSLNGSPQSGKKVIAFEVAQILGRPYFAFDCSHLTSLTTVQRLLAGTVQTGATLCLAGIDKLSLNVLQQVGLIMSYIQSQFQKKVAILGETELIYQLGTAIFTTFSTQKQANCDLRHRFSTFTLCKPDLRQFCECLLRSKGFENPQLLSHRMYLIWTLGSKTQVFTLAGAKWVISTAARVLCNTSCLEQFGVTKRMNLLTNKVSETKMKETVESLVLRGCITDLIGEKFQLLLNQIWSLNGENLDNYNGTAQPKSTFQVLSGHIRDVAYDMDHIPLQAMISKACCLSTAISHSRTVILHGGARSGKSTIYQWLARGLNRLKAQGDFIKTSLVFPQSLTLSQLYGTTSSRGLLEDLLHGFEFIQDVGHSENNLLAFNHRQWIVMDGNLDPSWMEHLDAICSKNALLNDSLCLPDAQLSTIGEQNIRIGPAVTFIFETTDLEHASPSFLHRSCLVSLGDSKLVSLQGKSLSVGDQPLYLAIVGAWIRRLEWTFHMPKQLIELLRDRLQAQTIVQRLLELVFSSEGERKHVFGGSVSMTSVVSSSLSLLQATLTPHFGINFTTAAHEGPKAVARELTKSDLCILWSLLWGIAGCVVRKHRPRVSEFLKKEFTSISGCWKSLRREPCLYDTVLDLKECLLVSCNQVLPQQITDSLRIPDAQSTLCQLVMQQALRSGRDVLLIGGSGSGKSITMRDFVYRLHHCSTQGLTSLNRKVERKEENAEENHSAHVRLQTTMLISRMTRRLKDRLAKACTTSSKIASPTGNTQDDAVTELIESGDVIPLYMKCTSKTPATYIQQVIADTLTSVRSNVYEPPSGHAAILMVDDIHLSQSFDVVRGITLYKSIYTSSPRAKEKQMNGVRIISTTTTGTGTFSRMQSAMFSVFLPAMNTHELCNVFNSKLCSYFDRRDFSQQIRQQARGLGIATVCLWQKLKLFDQKQSTLRVFSLDHLSKWCEYFQVVEPQDLKTGSQLVGLWVHEAIRVFCDPFPNSPAQNETVLRNIRLFKSLLRTQTNITIDSAKKFEQAQDTSGISDETSLIQGSVWGMDLTAEGTLSYRQIEQQPSWIEARAKDLPFTLTQAMIPTILRLCRVLYKRSGHVALVSQEDIGRSTLLTITCQVLKMERLVFEVGHDRQESMRKWIEVVRRIISLAATQHEIVLVIRHAERIDSIMLNQLISLMTQGYVPLIFSNQDREIIVKMNHQDGLEALRRRHDKEINDLELKMAEEKRRKKQLELQNNATDKEAWKTFEATYDLEMRQCIEDLQIRQQEQVAAQLEEEKVQGDIIATRTMALVRPGDTTHRQWNSLACLVRSKLRIALCLEEESNLTDLKDVLSCCTVFRSVTTDGDWLYAILQHEFYTHVDKSSNEAALKLLDDQETVLKRLCHFHQATKTEFLTTTKDAVQFLRLYIKLLLSESSLRQMNRLLQQELCVNQLKCILDLARNVNDGESTLASKRQELETQLNRIKDEIVLDKKRYQELNHQVSGFHSQMEDQKALVNEMAQAMESELKISMETLETANTALARLEKRDIVEIKSFSKPPPLVRLVMETVCVLFKTHPDWTSARRLLSDMNFVNNLMRFDRDSIDKTVLAKLQAYVADPSFTEEAVGQQSVAAGSIVLWVKAMDEYARMKIIIQPKVDALDKAKSELDVLKAKLDALENERSDLEEKIRSKSATSVSLIKQQQLLQKRLDASADQTQAQAETIADLKSHQTVVAEAFPQEKISVQEIRERCMFQAALTLYSSACDSNERQKLLQKWPESTDAMIRYFQSRESVWIRRSGVFHSKRDQYHALILSASTLIPTTCVLMTNHCMLQEQLLSNLVNVGVFKNHVLISATDTNLASRMKSCIVDGHTAIISNVSSLELSSIFAPIITRSRLGETFNGSLEFNDEVFNCHPLFQAVFITTQDIQTYQHDLIVVNGAMVFDDLKGKMLDMFVEQRIFDEPGAPPCTGQSSYVEQAMVEEQNTLDQLIELQTAALDEKNASGKELELIRSIYTEYKCLRDRQSARETELAKAVERYRRYHSLADLAVSLYHTFSTTNTLKGTTTMSISAFFTTLVTLIKSAVNDEAAARRKSTHFDHRRTVTDGTRKMGSYGSYGPKLIQFLLPTIHRQHMPLALTVLCFLQDNHKRFTSTEMHSTSFEQPNGVNLNQWLRFNRLIHLMGSDFSTAGERLCLDPKMWTSGPGEGHVEGLLTSGVQDSAVLSEFYTGILSKVSKFGLTSPNPVINSPQWLLNTGQLPEDTIVWIQHAKPDTNLDIARQAIVFFNPTEDLPEILHLICTQNRQISNRLVIHDKESENYTVFFKSINAMFQATVEEEFLSIEDVIVHCSNDSKTAIENLSLVLSNHESNDTTLKRCAIALHSHRESSKRLFLTTGSNEPLTEVCTSVRDKSIIAQSSESKSLKSYIKDTVIVLSLTPFCLSMETRLQSVVNSETRYVVRSEIWRVLSSLVVFHAILKKRQSIRISNAFYGDCFDDNDFTSAVLEVSKIVLDKTIESMDKNAITVSLDLDSIQFRILLGIYERKHPISVLERLRRLEIYKNCLSTEEESSLPWNCDEVFSTEEYIAFLCEYADNLTDRDQAAALEFELHESQWWRATGQVPLQYSLSPVDICLALRKDSAFFIAADALKLVLELQANLPSKVSPSQKPRFHRVLEAETRILTNLLSRVNAFIDKIKSELQKNEKTALEKTFSGNTLTILSDLLEDRVPLDWQTSGIHQYATLAEWLCHLQRQAASQSQWSCQSTFWLPGLTNFELLLDELKYEYALQIGELSSEIQLEFSFLTKEEAGEEEASKGVLLSGVCLNNAQWDQEGLSVANNKSTIGVLKCIPRIASIEQNEYIECPILPLLWTENKLLSQNEDEYLARRFELETPRTKEIVQVPFKISQNLEEWIPCDPYLCSVMYW